jgi:hypothetical protein
MRQLEIINGSFVNVRWNISVIVDEAGDGHVVTRLAEGEDDKGNCYVGGAIYCDDEFITIDNPQLITHPEIR